MSTEKDSERTIRAIREGLADVAAGRTVPLEEFDRNFRKRHGIPCPEVWPARTKENG